VDLNQPTFNKLGGAGTTYDNVVAVSVDDTVNKNAKGEYVCVTTDGSQATCAAGGACGGTGTAYAGGAVTAVPFPNAAPTAGSVNVNQAVYQAAACTGATNVFVVSGSFSSQAYNLKLDPVKFTPAAGTPIPASGTLSVTIGQGGTGLAYDYICWTQDATAIANLNCTCNTTANPTLHNATGASVGASVTPTNSTLYAVGCLNAPVAGTDTNVFAASDSPYATAGYQSATQMAQPTITPGANINNPTKIQFVNNEPAGAASAYFCYTTDGTAAAYSSTNPNVCYAAGSTHGSTICTGTPYTAPQASSAAAQGPSVTATGTTINAIACDSTSVLQGSKAATAVDYTLVVGNPTISPKTAVALGSALTITTATWPTGSNAVNIHYSEDGTTPDCSGAYLSLPVTCGGVACTCGGGACTDPTVMPDNGPFTATYYAMGGAGNTASGAAKTSMGGTLNVIACATGYTTSPVPDSTTLTPFSAPSPSFTTPSGAYDDYISVTLAEKPGVVGSIGGWFCVGPGAGCGASVNTCNGVGVVAQAATANYTLGAGNAHAGGQPSAAPSYASNSLNGTILPSATLGNTLSAVACDGSSTTGIVANPLASGAGSATYTFQTSAVTMTAPTTTTNIVGSTSVSFAQTKSTNPPDGNTTGPVSGATNGLNPVNGGPTFVCATTQPLPAQPSFCETLTGLSIFQPPLGDCQSDTTTQAAGATGPVLSGGSSHPMFADVGAAVSYNIVSCKDYMTWSTGAGSLSFQAYTHTVAMTGAVADFNTSENLSGADSATAYVSWNTQFLYLGMHLAGLGTTGSDYVEVYVGSSNGAGVGTEDNKKVLYGGGTAPSFATNFNALYHIWWKADGTDQGINAFAGSWANTTNNAFQVQFNQAADFVEFAIPLSSLANTGNDMHLAGDVRVGSARNGSWPAPPNGDTGSWSGWQAEFLNDAYTPNDPNNTGTKP
jgi:hypothetical protein